MTRIGIALASAIAMAIPAAAGDQPAQAADADAAAVAVAPPVSTVKRVGGDMKVTFEKKGDVYRSGSASIDTPLPEGYPPPTPPGAIELKSYPVVRRAQVSSGEGNPDNGRDGAFWPLFKHIQSRDIEMTAPVEMDYPGLTADPDSQPDGWTMAFLYRRVEQGPTGKDKSVVVVDAPPVTVVALGYQGSYDVDYVRENLKKLMLWLEQSPDWEQAGDPRAMFYNGPRLFWNRKWAEVQIPVRLKAPAGAAAEQARAAEPAEPAAPADASAPASN